MYVNIKQLALLIFFPPLIILPRLHGYACWVRGRGVLQPHCDGLLPHIPGVLLPGHRHHLPAGRHRKGPAICLPANPMARPELFICM